MSKKDKRERALENTVASLTKRFGEGVIMRLGEATHMQVDAIPTGALSLDIALGIGGVPRGRVVEIYGPESSGKTTLCQHIIAEAQKQDDICAFIDMEHALDPSYAAQCGVDINNLYISQPDTGEQALEIADALIRSGTMAIVVIDSVAALVPRAEIEGEMGDSHMHYASFPGSSNKQTQRSFLPISYGRKSVSCLATQKQPRAVMPSSFTLQLG